MAADFWETLSEADIQRRLAAAAHQAPDNPYPVVLFQGAPRPAAVLIPFLRERGAWHLLFIRRTRMPHDPHSGQVAFPGGRMERDEHDPVQVALREAEEEVGIAPEAVRVLGALPRQRTITNYEVTPVVGVIPWPYPVRRAVEEVARVFLVPLAWLADPRNWEVRRRHLPGRASVPVVYYRPYDGEVIWGATGRMVVRLIRILSGQSQGPVFPSVG